MVFNSSARTLFVLFSLSLLLACASPIQEESQDTPIIDHNDPNAAISFDSSDAPLTVTTDKGSFSFTLEIAKTDLQQARGMMFRTEMADDQGMLFVYDRPKRHSFWMKNTLIPLDIIFVRSTGKVANIIANAEPQTETHRRSVGRALAVLEIRGGLAAELGLKKGDVLRHPIFNNVK